VSEAQPTYPESATEENLGPVEVVVIVTVGPSGNLVDATIGSDPSHNSAIEHEALRVARTTTYAPHLVDCKPVTDEYRYLIDFNPD
jgi:TonB family protein